ncbi:MAG: hypothetical protein P4L46_09620 [Fimbriimonas sp.]|nr:hypothetical protein [Fimbriimonas sp.]
MTTTTHDSTELRPESPNLGRLAPAMSVIGAIGLIVMLVMMFTGDEASRRQAIGSYLFGFVFWIGITLGFFGLTLLHHTVRGRWSVSILRILEAGGGWVSIVTMFALFIPVLANLKVIYEWADPDKVAASEILQHKAPYLNVPFFAVRFVIYLLLWAGLAYFMRRSTMRQEQSQDFKLEAGRSSWGAAGMVMFFVTCTFAFTDWVMSLQASWYSTMYGAWQIVAAVLGALALSMYIFCINAHKPPYNTVWRPDLGRDLGNMLFTLTMLWGYTSLSQFLIIWNGNLPETGSYYIARSSNVPLHSIEPMTTNITWGFVGLIGILGQFFIPFFALIAPRTKKTPKNLAKICLWIFLVHITDAYLLVIPSLPGRGGPGPISPAIGGDILAFVAIGAIWFFVFGSQVKKAPLLPSYDTRLQEALQNAH